MEVTRNAVCKFVNPNGVVQMAILEDVIYIGLDDNGNDVYEMKCRPI